ncbi:Hint domain-containing protein [Arenibacterium sp. CAU 1754]
MPVPNPAPVQNVLVYAADDFCVTEGVNRGDTVSVMDDIEPDDIYELNKTANRHRLAIEMHGNGALAIAESSEVGTLGARLHLDCAVVLMSPDGQTTDALILVEVDADSRITAIYMLPLARIYPATGYRVVTRDRSGARKKFAQVACVSFARGTHITMASGAQKPIEQLKVGDRVLTRDDGAQAVRWIGHTTVRASGAFAPIVITAGTLNNTNDLMVGPDHRLFVYQRTDEIGAGQSELLVKARHIVNDDTVYIQNGGFIDYFQILFDRHHIIYAEGIAAESMLIDPRTRPVLPPELLEKMGAMLPGHTGRGDHGVDVQKALLDRPDVIDLLRRASTR